MLLLCDVIEGSLLEPPGKPKNLEAVDVDAGYITLAWEAPELDGNAPIEKYIVERRERSDKDWFTVGEAVASGDKRLKDEKVVEGKEYYYRVRAVNKAGPGDPCDHSRGILCKAKPG